jgi:hypothetical protein
LAQQQASFKGQKSPANANPLQAAHAMAEENFDKKNFKRTKTHDFNSKKILPLIPPNKTANNNSVVMQQLKNYNNT